MTTAIFKITDGTSSVDLLELREGVEARSWLPAVAQYKGGGTFQQSSLADGRRLVDKRFGTITEEIPVLNISSESSQDVTISILHKLFALMELASDYWVHDWVQTPVWIESRTECETNTRYAIVVVASIPNLDQIYAPGAFTSAQATLADMRLVIEHEHWTENEPETGTAVEIFNLEEYDGRTLGRTATTANEVFVASRSNESNLTDIYTWSAANGFSANLMDAALPYALIDTAGAAPAINDLVYFGVDTTPESGGSFSSLIFDIGTAQSGLGLVWEYWNGAAWVAIPAAELQDNTNTGGQPLDTTGVNSVVHGTGTAPRQVINGVTAWWIRLRVTAVGVVTAPTQQNRDVYTVSWPYVEIDSGQVSGNIQSLASIKIYPQADETVSIEAVRRVFVGLRSLSRGSNFNAYLNASDQQTPANVTVAITGAITFTTSTSAPTGRLIVNNFALAVPVMTSQFTITLDAPLTAEYYGKFRAFLRVARTTTVGTDISLQVVTTMSSGGSSTTSPQTTSNTQSIQVVDLGAINIPLSPLKQSEIVDQIVFDVQAQAPLPADTMQFVDLVLVPVDEWACDTSDFVLSTNSKAEVSERLLIDSITQPKVPLRSYVSDLSTGYLKTVWFTKKNNPALLQRNTDQRLWFMFFDIDTSSEVSEWDVQHLASIQIEKVQRYLGPRGTM